jgi:hypothetical protein
VLGGDVSEPQRLLALQLAIRARSYVGPVQPQRSD